MKYTSKIEQLEKRVPEYQYKGPWIEDRQGTFYLHDPEKKPDHWCWPGFAGEEEITPETVEKLLSEGIPCRQGLGFA